MSLELNCFIFLHISYMREFKTARKYETFVREFKSNSIQVKIRQKIKYILVFLLVMPFRMASWVLGQAFYIWTQNVLSLLSSLFHFYEISCR